MPKSPSIPLELSTVQLLYDVSRELTTALDLDTVLKRILELCIKHIEAENGSIIVMDEAGVPINSAVMFKQEIVAGELDDLKFTLESGLAGWVVKNHEAVLILNTVDDERWTKREYSDQKSKGPKAAISVPLIVREVLIGVMTFTHSQNEHFTQDHLALIQAISDQAAIAALNARLFDQAQDRAAVMGALAESAAAINTSIDMDEVLQLVLEQAKNALKAEAVSLSLIDRDMEQLVFKASIGPGAENIIGLKLPIGQGVAGDVAKTGERAIVADVSLDKRFYPHVDKLSGMPTRSLVAMPILVHDRIIGVVEAVNPVINSSTPVLLDGLSNLAGSAIHHAQLFQEAQLARVRYLELFEDSVGPIFITRMNGEIREANRRAESFTGYRTVELVGMNIKELHTINTALTGVNFQLTKDVETTIYESKLKLAGGEILPVEVSLRRVLINGKERLQWMLRDTTGQKELDQMREDLLAMIYHDLRSPLGNVVSSLDLLAAMMPLEEEPELADVLDIAMRSTERVQRLSSSLLDVARLEAGQKITQLDDIDLHKILNEVANLTASVIERKGQKFKLELPEKSVAISIDEDMIRRVLINLLENAMKYTKEGTLISLGAKIEKGKVVFIVKDNGKGIPKDEQPRIFGKYERVSDAQRTAQGLGLGLAFCKLAVEAHGGEIWVESEVGEGATFLFTLPLS